MHEDSEHHVAKTQLEPRPLLPGREDEFIRQWGHHDGITLREVAFRTKLSIIFEAEQCAEGVNKPRVVAVKVPRVDLKNQGLDSQRYRLELFNKERELAFHINDEEVIKVYATGTSPSFGMPPSKIPYFVMPYIKGHPLLKYVALKRLSGRRRVRLFIQVCEAVGTLHSKLVHLDLKPENILVTARGKIQILDFGVAADLSTFQQTRHESGPMTPEYAAPEQISRADGYEISPAADVYALGVILYELLAGRLPCRLPSQEDQRNEIDWRAKVHSIKTDARTVETALGVISRVAKPFSEVIRACLDSDPTKRPRNGKQLAENLLAAGRYADSLRNKRLSLAAGVVVAGVLGATVWLQRQSSLPWMVGRTNQDFLTLRDQESPLVSSILNLPSWNQVLPSMFEERRHETKRTLDSRADYRTHGVLLIHWPAALHSEKHATIESWMEGDSLVTTNAISPGRVVPLFLKGGLRHWIEFDFGMDKSRGPIQLPPGEVLYRELR